MRLSIITVAFNNAEGLVKTLRSVSSQTFTDYEEIVVDGGSTDDSVDILKSFEGNIKNYRWVSELDNGIYDAMNKGIVMATGTYCLFLNSGDILEDDAALDVLFKNDITADIVSCNAVFEKSKFHEERLIMSPNEITAEHLILSFLPHQATLLHTRLFGDIHPYDTSFRIISDWLFFIEAILRYDASYQHVQMFLARCETEGISSNPDNNALMDKEFHQGLKKVLPEQYEYYATLRKLRMNKEVGKESHLMRIVRRILKKIGFYEKKSAIKQKKYFKKIKKEDARKKKLITKEIEKFPSDMLLRNNDASDFIVSLTSYGNRVADSAPYAIYSMFKQSRLPNRIILWLDKDKYNDQNIPYLLKRLKQSGLEVRYCKDIKSYKKLIPSLEMFPDNPIITIDDDFYYNHDFVKWMVEAYWNSDKKTVFATWGCIPEKREGKYIPYSLWRDCKYGNNYSEYSLFGGGGIYPPHVFDEEIFKEELFTKLCPTADDIWFWVQELRNGIKTSLTKNNGFGLHESVNRINDFTYEGTLFLTNGIGRKNDEQLKAALEYYKIQ